MTKFKLNTNSALLLLTVILNCSTLFAQKPNCSQKLLAFEEGAKELDFNEVYASWSELKKLCPEESVFISAEKILSQHVTNASASDAKNQMIQKLVSVYDEHDKAFPNNKNGNRISKALLLFDNKQGSSGEIFTFLDQAFKTDNASFTSPNLLNIYANLVVSQYNSEEKKLSVDQLLEKLDQIQEKVQSESKKVEGLKDNLEQKAQTESLSAEDKNLLQNAKTTLREFGLVSQNLNGNLNKIVDCEKLIAFYEKGFEKNAENALWLERASERLNAKKCNTDLYVKVTEKWNALNPSAKSAYDLAIIARKNRDKEKTIEYFMQSASLQKDGDKKSDLFYLIATTYGNTDKPKAREFAKKAIQAKPSSGKSYIFLAQLYANSSNECGKDNFDKRAIYWLAATTAKQAGVVEPALKKSADQLMDDFNQKAPSKKEISQAKRKAGEQISYDCWLGESVSIPKL
ncbi:hypothetical protein [uncultured Flavobacterium sp.]|uniref:tetratricopeptide repeat protein n=1 Tax=uncultured Flavobacterium sp. TaxID=165435 RepID=UPI0025D88339|nr:hypothetical protein [uncultured Flavobacterium sp.]